jgi:hypothetical protein
MVWRQWISCFTCTSNWAETFFPSKLMAEQQQKSSFTCTTDLQQFIIGRPRQIAILNCTCLHGYIIVSWWKRGVMCVSPGLLGTVIFLTLIFSRLRYIKTKKCITMYESTLHIPYCCYMFRPLMWPSAGRCITKDRYIEILQKVLNQCTDIK